MLKSKLTPKQREDKCAKELQKLLKKYDCAFGIPTLNVVANPPQLDQP